MHQQRGANRLLQLLVIVSILQGCKPSEESDDTGMLSNSAPVLSGKPMASVVQGSTYQFLPAASDADGDSLIFSIANRPVWALFNSITGSLRGTPTANDIGSYDNIIISANDGQETTSLSAFSVVVKASASPPPPPLPPPPPSGNTLGSATLSWQAPTTYEDGSPLTDLAGYRIFWGQSSESYSDDVIVMNPGIATFVVDNLSGGATYYFAVKAINSEGVESAFSNEASKSIP